MTSCWLFLLILSVKGISGDDLEGQQIANRLGDDLSFASKQVIRGFTSIFGPILDSIQGQAKGSEGEQNFRRVIFRDGINAIGKGAKAGATILSAPARVAGVGIEEARKVGEAVKASGNADTKSKVPLGKPLSVEDRTKLVSTFLNTTSSQLSQANLGAVLVEVAVKNRIKDIGNKTTGYVQTNLGQTPAPELKTTTEGPINKREDEVTTKSSVDDFIEQFNAAVKRNDERLLNALKLVIAQINPPTN